ncbi:MAG: hypothetical protein DMG06_16275 [Acidobacteria bacterium]|nr:MAG: hypothetical protein DMG06_16275 [Acidobacteriota bacterium]
MPPLNEGRKSQKVEQALCARRMNTQRSARHIPLAAGIQIQDFLNIKDDSTAANRKIGSMIEVLFCNDQRRGNEEAAATNPN